MNDVGHVMKKHQQPVTESQTLDGASCSYSQRSKVVAAVGRSSPASCFFTLLLQQGTNDTTTSTKSSSSTK